MSKISLILLVSILVGFQGVFSQICTGSGLGMSVYFSGIFNDSFRGRFSDIGGRLATGGDADIMNYGIGDGLFNISEIPNRCPTPDEGIVPFSNFSLIVGGGLTIEQSRVYYGGAIWGEDADIEISEADVGENCPFQKEDVRHHIAEAWENLTVVSDEVISLPSSLGSRSKFMVPLKTYKLRLNGDADFELFTLNTKQLEASSIVRLDGELRENASIIIRVMSSGGKRSFSFRHKDITGQFATYSDRILWTFSPHLHQVHLANMTWHGSILAVNANIDAKFGQIYGSVYAKSFNADLSASDGSATMQISLKPFLGQTPAPCDSSIQ